MTEDKVSGSFFMNVTGPGTEPCTPGSTRPGPFVYEYIMCVHVSFVKEKYFEPQISLTALKGQLQIKFCGPSLLPPPTHTHTHLCK